MRERGDESLGSERLAALFAGQDQRDQPSIAFCRQMHETAPLVTALVSHHDLEAGRQLFRECRNQAGVLGAKIMGESFSSLGGLRVFAKYSAVDVIAQTHAHELGDVARYRCNVGVLRA